MDFSVVRDAAEASTYCVGNVVAVQREALSLLLWKKVPTPPFGQMVQALSERLEDLVSAVEGLSAYVRLNPLEEAASDSCIKLLEDSEAALRFIATAMAAFVSQRSRRDADLERIIGMLAVATESVQDARWTLMVSDGLQGPASSKLYDSGSELVEASLAC